MAQKILVVDDEAHIRNLLEQILEELEDDGVELLFAEDGEQALEVISQEKPSLIFLDIMMPKLNGYEVCEKVKNDPSLEEIYVVLLTAKGQQADKYKGDQVRANEYITKPFDPDVILEKAKEILKIS